MENKEDFSGRYLKGGFAIQILVKNFFNCIKNLLYDLEIKNVLEVGCGPGFSTQYLSKILKGKDFQASDIRLDLVKEAQERNPDIKIQQESIYELKREPNSFDLVIAELALRELHRVTSKYCLISVPNEPLWRILNICRLKYLKEFGNTPGHI